MTNSSKPEPPAATPVTPEMVQQAVGKFGADLPWCRAVAAKLNTSLSHSQAEGASEQDVESLSAKFHEIYQQEAKRQGDVRHKDAYADLPENIKEFDRVLARYVLSLFPSGDKLREIAMRHSCYEGKQVREMFAEVRQLALEEAAKIADSYRGHNSYTAWEQIAADIRALASASAAKPEAPRALNRCGTAERPTGR